MPKRILLADDSITIQKVVELTFSDGDYEVTAVNNGAKAIQKLSELRPDIILSDIIMPEKNGYEVCEYVKSHPDLRKIPVVLLTGTFEPFDPDRAEKAGCDAVVTKPFESQSLIHKVEELILHSKSAAGPATPAPAAPSFEPPSPFSPAETPAAVAWSAEPHEVPFAAAPPVAPPPPPAADPFATAFHAHSDDIFAATPASAPPTTEMPFETEPPAEAFGGETRAFPRMTFDDLQRISNEPATPPPAALPEHEPASPWDEPPHDEAPTVSTETRAFPRMTFEDLQRMAHEPVHTPPPPPPPAVEAAPWEPAADHAGETRAFPQMTFEDLAAHADAAPAAPPAQEESPWDQPTAPHAIEDPGATRAFPRMSFDELQAMAQPSAVPPPPPSHEPAPWEEPATTEPGYDFSSETRALPRMSFDELQKMSTQSALPDEEPVSWETPEPTGWTPPDADAPAAGRSEQFATGTFSVPEAPVEKLHTDESPFAAPELPPAEDLDETQTWAPAGVSPAPEPVQEAVPEAKTGQLSALVGAKDLTDEQVDRIARRVVQLMSEQVVRNIAWEVIPDVAEMEVKKRIRELESEG
ncbi:MAG TPA: response regulator [Thermoanaerobaculia bacterium]|nr:response regulator [Thermoanaerobaculia bacterium]